MWLHKAPATCHINANVSNNNVGSNFTFVRNENSSHSNIFSSNIAEFWGKVGSKAAIAITAFSVVMTPLPGAAVLSSPVLQVARTADVALRRSIPAFNEDVLYIQTKLESIQYKLRIPQRKPWGAMSKDALEATQLANEVDKMIAAVPNSQRDAAVELISGVQSELQRLTTAIDLKDPDRTSIRTANALERIASLELLQAPGLPYPIPKVYEKLPRLVGRALVEITIQNSNETPVFLPSNSENGPSKEAKLQLVLDGFSAPITAGNFMKHVLDGDYNGSSLSVSRESVLTGRQGSGVGSIPLEIREIGEFEPTYRSQLDVLAGELPVLPLSIQGAVAMAHLPGADNSVGYVSAEQFFIYKFDRSSSGLAGFAYDEGSFGVFGYVVNGKELLSKIGDGDVLLHAKVLQGEDKLIIP